MDELPELLVEAVGGETVLATVGLGGGDRVAVTPARTHVYRSEGLLSDESVSTYGHDVERFATDAGRRKTTLLLQTLDGESQFAVPSSVEGDVVAAMLEGILRTDGVVDDGETVDTQFRFSDLTLVMTDRQLLKHVGSAVWDDEFEAYRYEDLEDLEFEEGSVATQVVLESDGRQQRVKVPNDHAGRVRQAIQTAVFEFHGVSSLGGLRAAVGADEADDGDEGEDEAAEDEADDAAGDATGGGDAAADAGGATADEADEADAGAESETAGEDDGFVSADWSPPADQDMARADDRPGGDADDVDAAETGSASGEAARTSVTDVPGAAPDADGETPADVEAVADAVDALSQRVERQTELIERQQETIEQLVEELRRGR
jgi:hypothetical protein